MYIGHNLEQCEKLNWNDKIEQIKKILLAWEKRNLTMLGKITLIKTLILPKLTFLATNTTIPPGLIKDINKILFSFIWGKRDRIKRNVLIHEVENGGIGMVDIEAHFQAVKASWVERILKTEDNWNFLAKAYLNRFGVNNICLSFNHVNMINMPCLNSVPKFYQEIIISHSTSYRIKTPDN